MSGFKPDSGLVDSVIPARWFTPGPRAKGAVRVLVIHDTESPEVPTGAENVAKWGSTTTTKASWHYVVDNNSVVQSVKESDIAWHCPSINHDGIGVEHVGYARQSSDGTGWGDAYSQAMLKISARLFADLCVRHNIPPVLLSPADLKAGKKGISTHANGSLAYKPGGHTDPGRGFPINQFMAWVVAEVIRLTKPVTPAPINPILPPQADGVNSRIVGADQVTLAQCEKYVNAHRQLNANGYTVADIHTILNAYQGTCITVGASLGVAVAQLCHETGFLTSFWSKRPQRNPAGIGVSGQAFATEAQAKVLKQPYAYHAGEVKPWVLGNSFANWAPGAVDAHVGRLLAYAIPVNDGNANQKRLIAIALKARPLPIRYRGIAPTIDGLRGTWAVPGTLYPQALARHIDAMVKS